MFYLIGILIFIFKQKKKLATQKGEKEQIKREFLPSRMNFVVSRPTQSINSKGPMGQPAPSFMAMSMSRAVASPEDKHIKLLPQNTILQLLELVSQRTKAPMFLLMLQLIIGKIQQSKYIYSVDTHDHVSQWVPQDIATNSNHRQEDIYLFTVIQRIKFSGIR